MKRWSMLFENLEACTGLTTRAISGLMWQGSLDTLTADSRQIVPGNMQPALITAPGAACRFRLAFGGRLETRCRSWLSPSLARLQRSAADPTIKVVYLLAKSIQNCTQMLEGALICRSAGTLLRRQNSRSLLCTCGSGRRCAEDSGRRHESV